MCGFEEGMGGGGDRCVWREGGANQSCSTMTQY